MVRYGKGDEETADSPRGARVALRDEAQTADNQQERRLDQEAADKQGLAAEPVQGDLGVSSKVVWQLLTQDDMVPKAPIA